jgi:hypothetical protein
MKLSVSGMSLLHLARLTLESAVLLTFLVGQKAKSSAGLCKFDDSLVREKDFMSHTYPSLNIP